MLLDTGQGPQQRATVCGSRHVMSMTRLRSAGPGSADRRFVVNCRSSLQLPSSSVSLADGTRKALSLMSTLLKHVLFDLERISQSDCGSSSKNPCVSGAR